MTRKRTRKLTGTAGTDQTEHAPAPHCEDTPRPSRSKSKSRSRSMSRPREERKRYCMDSPPAKATRIASQQPYQYPSRDAPFSIFSAPGTSGYLPPTPVRTTYEIKRNMIAYLSNESKPRPIDYEHQIKMWIGDDWERLMPPAKSVTIGLFVSILPEDITNSEF